VIKRFLFLIVFLINLASAEVYETGDSLKYGLLFYLSIGIAIVIFVIILIFVVKFLRGKLKVKIKGGKIGEEIRFIINPSKEGVGRKASILLGHKVVSAINLCEGEICFDKKVLRYKIPKSWVAGKYKFQVHDYSKNQKEDFLFEVR